MTLYRIKQFYWGITSKMSSKDEEFIIKYLNKIELELFNKLPIYDKVHCIRTAKEVEKKSIKNYMLIKAALLHDIGKVQTKLNLIDKSIMVLLDKFTRGKIKRFNRIKKIDIYYNHAEIGYNILKKYDYDQRFLYLIKNHHNSDIIEDVELNILKECDSKN